MRSSIAGVVDESALGQAAVQMAGSNLMLDPTPEGPTWSSSRRARGPETRERSAPVGLEQPVATEARGLTLDYCGLQQRLVKTGPACEARPLLLAESHLTLRSGSSQFVPQAVENNGRPERTRTVDLYRVKVAL